MLQRNCVLSLAIALTSLSAFGQNLQILLPERTRLLQDQRVDLVVEVRNAPSAAGLRVTANGTDISARFEGPTQIDLDCNGTTDAVYRANLYGFNTVGNVRVIATLGSAESIKDVTVQPFSPAAGARRKNVILYIGDAMGTAYRDAARLVARSVDTVPGVSGLREGYFDNLLEMDKMPVSGMAMTFASDRLVPDSANTASTWSTGNKIMFNAMGVFPDGTDCAWRAAGRNATTLASLLDNPRLETLWEYLKRRYEYKTGIVTTADVTDATPAGEATHTGHRETRAAITLQYLENPMLAGQPAFDVILGGGIEQFEADKRADRRDLLAEFRAKGFTYATTATEMNAVPASAGRLLGLFRRGNGAALNSSGIRATPDGNMDVAYDKLGLTRPGSEPVVNFNGFTDQPFLDRMTQKAIDILSGPNGDQPFIMMVEAASIDKQSHPNHAAGTIWDTIELDKAVGVGRAWAGRRANNDTLLLVSADHDQSMHIIGVVDVSDEDLFDRTNFQLSMTSPGAGAQTARIFKDAYTNVRAGYNYANPSDAGNTSGREGPPVETFVNFTEINGFPDYLDSNGDGYPENRAQGGRGRRRLSVGFRTGNHTGSVVPVTAEGPGALLFTGYYDQGDIMRKTAAALSSDTTAMDNMLRQINENPNYPKVVGK
ncbi:MAG: alkaline phosphatase [Bryobacteraceae bacterium]|nr:alkaline phosphatase [Bryobacteraceae bacterium]